MASSPLGKACGYIGWKLGKFPSEVLLRIEEHGLGLFLFDMKVLGETAPREHDGTLTSDIESKYEKYGIPYKK